MKNPAATSGRRRPRRGATVQDKVLKAAAEGILADFRIDGEIGAEIDGAFLVKLLVGALEAQRVHPRGLRIAGLDVTDGLDLEAFIERVDRDGPLPGFYAETCSFSGPIDLTAVRINWFGLQDCDVNAAEVSEEAEPVSISAYSMEVAQSFAVANCRLSGGLALPSARVGHDLVLSGTTLSGGQLDLTSVVIGKSLHADGFRVVSDAPCGAGIVLNTATIGAGTFFREAEISGSITAINAVFNGIYITGCRVNTACINLDLDTAINSAEVEGGMLPFAVDLTRSQVGALFVIGSRISGAFRADAISAHDILFENTKLFSPDGRDAISFSLARADYLAFRDIDAIGGMEISGSVVEGYVEITSCRVHRAKFSTFLGKARSDVALSSANMSCAGITIAGCLLDGSMNLSGSKIRASIEMAETHVISRTSKHSLDISRCEIGNSLIMERCALFAGLQGVLANVGAELRLQSCSLGTPTYHETIALWLSNARIGRFLWLDGLAIDGQIKRNEIWGEVQLCDIRIEGDFVLRSTLIDIRPIWVPDGSCKAIVMDGAAVGGDLYLACRKEEDPLRKGQAPAEIYGAVDLNGAVIEGTLQISRTRFYALGERNHQADQMVGYGGQGVALSLARAEIKTSLELEEGNFSGVVDLRGTSVDTLIDRGTRSWPQARGALLLDGFVYRLLASDPFDQRQPRQWIDPAARRLAWIKMQTPTGPLRPEHYLPQPYQQLASVLASEGNERGRRMVVIARRELQRKTRAIGRFERQIALVLKLTSDYGYSPAKTLLCLTLLIAAGAGFAQVGIANGVFTRKISNEASALYVASRGGTTEAAEAVLSRGAGQPNSLVYSIDAALPFVDLDQANDYIVESRRFPTPLNAPLLWSVLRLIYQLAAAILISITLLTFTGTLREKE